MKKKQVNIYLTEEVNDFLAEFASDIDSNKSVITENLIKEHLMKKDSDMDIVKHEALKKQLQRINDSLNDCLEISENITKLSLKR